MKLLFKLTPLLIALSIFLAASRAPADTTAPKSKSKDSESATNAAPASVTAPSGSESKKDDKPETKPEKKLTGEELYTINCNRCHAERYPTEFTSGQWKTVLTHMRVRANIPAKQAKEILKYLQEDSGH